VLAPFKAATGRGVLANAPWSGTAVLDAFGEEHMRTGDLIVYTSADSVFQIAAHEEIVPLETLYEYCHIARKQLQGKHGVGRVIARPFVGSGKGNFKRTSNRHDYSLEPPKKTVLDAIKEQGLASIAVGKIYDIFAGIGTTEHVYNTSNANGMEHALHYADQDFKGLCFVNLVDFDMVYGHRRNIDGYAEALSEFDAWLPKLMEKLGDEDVVMITADHGCDPGYAATTDHTREYVPLMILGKQVKPVNLGTRASFADIAATVAELLDVKYETPGQSFAKEIL
jgi:phosphopentomutase